MLRDFSQKDRDEVLAMAADFYTGPGVLHIIPPAHFAAAFDECLAGNPYTRGFVIEKDGVLSGYMLLSLTYSSEAGGLTVLLEELYIKPSCRGGGLGHEALSFLFSAYPQAKRFRLEVAPDNLRAKELYAREGFTELPYIQMILEP
ncbi:MAG: GNAT family N-acetyltransferase [Oscillospiraceae bacterium]|nr:GNAT family N-acetyltransferase [Oscillospiraceae bacterium]